LDLAPFFSLGESRVAILAADPPGNRAVAERLIQMKSF